MSFIDYGTSRLMPLGDKSSTFSENFQASWELNVFTDRVLSMKQNLLDEYQQEIDDIAAKTGKQIEHPLRNTLTEKQRIHKTLSNLGRDRGKPRTTPRQYHGEQFQKFHETSANIAYDHGISVRSSDEIRKSIADKAKELELTAAEIASRATWTGAVGGFVGATGALVTEPVVMATMLLGAPRSAGIIKTALAEALIGGTTEALIQPIIQNYRNELGLDAGWRQGLQNVGMATAGSGAFAGVLKSLGVAIGRSKNVRQLTKMFREIVESPTDEQMAALRELENLLDTEEISVVNPNDPEANAIFTENLNRAERALAEGRVLRDDEVVTPPDDTRPIIATTLEEELSDPWFEVSAARTDIDESLKPGPRRPRTLFGEIRRLGGIRVLDAKGRPTKEGQDVMGALQDVKTGGIITQTQRLDDNSRVPSMTPDEMREELNQTGWFGTEEGRVGSAAGDEMDSFYDLLRRQADDKGKGVYHPESEYPAFLQSRDDVDEEFTRAGIDVRRNMTPEEKDAAALDLAKFRLQQEADSFNIPYDENTTPAQLRTAIEPKRAKLTDRYEDLGAMLEDNSSLSRADINDLIDPLDQAWRPENIAGRTSDQEVITEADVLADNRAVSNDALIRENEAAMVRDFEAYTKENLDEEIVVGESTEEVDGIKTSVPIVKTGSQITEEIKESNSFIEELKGCAKI